MFEPTSTHVYNFGQLVILIVTNNDIHDLIEER